MSCLYAFVLLLPYAMVDDKPDTQKVLTVAKEMADATIAGEYAKVLDRTYPGIIKVMGGRDKALQVTQTAMDRIKDQGISIKSFTTLKPGPFEVEGANTFVVVPTEMEMTLPTGKLKAKSYL